MQPLPRVEVVDLFPELHAELIGLLRGLAAAEDWRRPTACPVTTPGTAVTFHVTGEAGDTWSLVRREDGWDLFAGAPGAPAAVVTLSDDAAWRLFTKGLKGEAARERVAIAGEGALGEPALRALAIMG